MESMRSAQPLSAATALILGSWAAAIRLMPAPYETPAMPTRLGRRGVGQRPVDDRGGVGHVGGSGDLDVAAGLPEPRELYVRTT